MEKTQTSIRITQEAKALIEALAKKNGIPKTSVIEIAVRRFAEAEKIAVEPQKEGARHEVGNTV